MPTKPTPKRTSVGSVPAFIAALRRIPSPSPGFFAYRGMRRRWNLQPGLLRANNVGLMHNEREAIRDLQAVYPQEFSEDVSMFDRLVRMQHFNLPTRLLDVTANPLVALYFATEEVNNKIEDPEDGIVTYFTVPPSRKKYFDSDTVSCVANLSNLSQSEKDDIVNNLKQTKSKFNTLPTVDRLLQFIRSEKPEFRALIDSDELDRRWYVTPKLSNRRIIAQRGAFIIYGLDTGRISVPKGSEAITAEHIIINKTKKKSIREELDMLGINQAALFPEIDRAAEYIVARYN